MSSEKPPQSSSRIPPPTDPYARYATPYEHHPSDDEHNPFIEFRRFADRQFSNMFGGFNKMFGMDERNKHMEDIREDLKRNGDLMRQIQEDLRSSIGEEQKKIFEQMFHDFIRPEKASDLTPTEAATAENVVNQPTETNTKTSTPPVGDELPPGWESKVATNGRRFYVDHNERNTSWEKPDTQQPSEHQITDMPQVSGTATQRLDSPDTELDIYERFDELRQADERAEMWKRGFKNCPELRDDEDDEARRQAEMWRRGFRNCPGLQHEQADLEQERAEIWRRGFKNCPGLRDNHCSRKQSKLSSWLPTLGLGYDGQRRLQQLQKTSDASTQTHPSPKTYTSRDLANMDPFTEPAHLTPWAAMSSYSPVLLINPRMPAFDSVKVADDGSHLDLLESRLSPERNDSAFADALSQRVDWIEAFQDLHSMDPNNQLSHERDDDTRLNWPAKISTKSSVEPFEPAFQPIFGIGLPSSAFPSPEEVIAAVHRAEELSKAPQQGEQRTHSFTAPRSSHELPLHNDSHSWTSTSTTSYNSDTDDQPSVVSTLTKTTSRTLPDGSVETKRVLKKKFADGREENEESVDLTPNARKRPNAETSVTENPTRRAITDAEGQIEKKPESTKKPGWFWL